MARKAIIAANWKMNKTHLEAIHFIEALRNKLKPDSYDRTDVVICPPFTAIRSVQTTIDGDDLPMSLGAQNVYWEPSGAYTGEISPMMLSKLNVKYVIVGHSERRELFGETDKAVNQKAKAVFENAMIPIMCVGETLEEREADQTETKVTTQVKEGLKGLTKDQVAAMVIAYEPIWAIGTGRTASSDDAQNTVHLIRKIAAGVSGEASEQLRIQYGGSVKAGNISELMSKPDIDGALVGGASLDPEEFARIVEY